jgi:hypothetical protein
MGNTSSNNTFSLLEEEEQEGSRSTVAENGNDSIEIELSDLRDELYSGSEGDESEEEEEEEEDEDEEDEEGAEQLGRPRDPFLAVNIENPLGGLNELRGIFDNRGEFLRLWRPVQLHKVPAVPSLVNVHKETLTLSSPDVVACDGQVADNQNQSVIEEQGSCRAVAGKNKIYPHAFAKGEESSASSEKAEEPQEKSQLGTYQLSFSFDALADCKVSILVAATEFKDKHEIRCVLNSFIFSALLLPLC